MEMVDSTGKCAYCGNGIYSLPDKVGRIEVCTDNITYCVTETKEGFGVVHAKAGMHFKSDMLEAVGFTELCFFLPIRNKNFVPLVIKDFKKILGPRAGYPVGMLGFGAIAGTAGECYNRIHTKLFCQKHRISEICTPSSRLFFIGVNGIAVYGQSLYGHSEFFYGSLEFFKGFFIVKKHLGVAMSFAGISAAAQLKRFYADRAEIFKRFAERHTAQQISKYAKCHICETP